MRTPYKMHKGRKERTERERGREREGEEDLRNFVGTII